MKYEYFLLTAFVISLITTVIIGVNIAFKEKNEQDIQNKSIK